MPVDLNIIIEGNDFKSVNWTYHIRYPYLYNSIFDQQRRISISDSQLGLEADINVRFPLDRGPVDLYFPDLN